MSCLKRRLNGVLWSVNIRLKFFQGQGALLSHALGPRAPLVGLHFPQDVGGMWPGRRGTAEPEGESPSAPSGGASGGGVVPYRTPPDLVAGGKLGSASDLVRYREWKRSSAFPGADSFVEWKWRELARRLRRLVFKRWCWGLLGGVLRSINAEGRSA